MGKKAKTKTAGAATKTPATTVELDDQVAGEVKSVRTEADRQFVTGDYEKALETYDRVLKMLPENHQDVAVVHSNKGACYLKLKKPNETIKECEKALEIDPTYPRALQRRAKAYELKGLFKPALSDLQTLNKSENATGESREAEQKLRDVIAGRKPRSAAAQPQSTQPSTTANSNRQMAINRGGHKQPPLLYFSAKVTLDGDTRVIHFSPNVSYAQLLDMVKGKFPKVGPFMLKYVDQDGDMPTITCREDIQIALQQLLLASDKQLQGSAGPKLNNMLPSLRVEVCQVDTAKDVPIPPDDELREHNLRSQSLKAQSSASKGHMQENEVYELDEWLVDFANLFKECLGIEPDKHVDLHQEGWEKCTRALDQAIHSDQAMPLFSQAADKFKDVTATGLYNWGNVHVCLARKMTDEAASPEGNLATATPKIVEALSEGERRYHQALEYKDDYADAMIAIGQVALERAKLISEFVIPPPKSPELKDGLDKAEIERVNESTAKMAAEAMKEVLKTIDPEKVKSAEPYFETAAGYFQRACLLLPEEDKENKAVGDETQENGQVPNELMSLRNQLLVMWGNMLYEQSQLWAAVGREWQPLLDDATSKFQQAGCAIKDIRQALKNHFKGDEVELPPLPESPEEEAEENKEEAADPVKGLPALPKKPETAAH